MNLAAGHDPLDTYLRCAALSWRSFERAGYEWQLVTDDRDRLERRCAILGFDGLPIREESFRWEVPEGLRFRAAHYKLELLTLFGSGSFGDRPALVDLDVVCMRRLPVEVTAAKALVGYNLSSLEASGQAGIAVAASLALLSGCIGEPEWWGGEFMLGGVDQYAPLAKHIEELWPRYLDACDSMTHVGDEMVLTASLQALRENGGAVLDGGQAGAVTRFWSARTTQVFPPFDTVARSAILHLPADKPFLANYPAEWFDPEAFLGSYRNYLKRRIPPRRVAAQAARLFGGKRRFAPSL